MKRHLQKLKELQDEMKTVIEDVERGKLDHAKAADRITEIREHIDNLITEMKKANQTSS